MLLVRADANSSIGLGHAMRCLALVEAWLDAGGTVTFASRDLPDALAARVERTGARLTHVTTPDDVSRLARETQARIALVDGYHFGVEHHRALKASGARLAVIDDFGESATELADVILNQNAGATVRLYAHLDSNPRLLLGSSFTLLRREVRSCVGRRETREHVRHVLVSFGGADPADVTPRAIEALASIPGLEVLVIAGAANPRAKELRIPETASSSISIEPSVEDMAERMTASDLAVVAAGSTCWELAALGVPIVATTVAQNQRPVGAAIANLGLGVLLSDAADIRPAEIRSAVVELMNDPAARVRMSTRGPEVIDGNGAARVCAALREYAGALR